ncbi:MAG: DUF899 family protein [Ignavibacteria bacterium]|nr:DUF899 family protein [Ignavibacteria bacterium]
MKSSQRRDAAKCEVENYAFTTTDGSTKVLSELFGAQRDLIIIHNMGKGCRYCTLWADGLNGMLPQMQSRTAVALLNGDSPETQKEFSESRGWNFAMMHDNGGAFTDEMGFSTVVDGKRHLIPGFSTFYKNDDGTILRVGADAFGPGDLYMPLFPMFDMLKDGVADWQPQYKY